MMIEIKATLEVSVPDAYEAGVEKALYEQCIHRAVNAQLFGGRQAVRRVTVEVGDLE
jgi:hypothetical protein